MLPWQGPPGIMERAENDEKVEIQCSSHIHATGHPHVTSGHLRCIEAPAHAPHSGSMPMAPPRSPRRTLALVLPVLLLPRGASAADADLLSAVEVTVRTYDSADVAADDQR